MGVEESVGVGVGGWVKVAVWVGVVSITTGLQLVRVTRRRKVEKANSHRLHI